MKKLLNCSLAAVGIFAAAQASAQVTLYERENYQGRSFTVDKRVSNLGRRGFNNRASSVVVDRDRWEVCDADRYGGRCVVLRPGKYSSLASMGLNDRISSLRPLDRNARIDERRYAPDPVTDDGYRRRDQERLYEANIDSVRAVVGPPEQRCWIESEQVPQEKAKANVGGAIAGAVIGGILGHQVGGGRGKDIATVGGAVAGGMVGANVGRGEGTPATTKDVQHCATTPSQAKPEFWDVTYTFRGQEHRVQMTAPPGPTITVNEQGEPRSQQMDERR